MRALIALFLLSAAAPIPATAGDVTITDVKARPSGGAWTFSVTLLHADTGWDHYADGWEVRGPDGKVLGHRKLFHPHVDEQPFTRSLSGVKIPDGVRTVTVHAHDSVHGWAEESFSFSMD